MHYQCWPAEAALLPGERFKSMHIEAQCETHKACGRGEEKPAVFDDRAGAIANHVLYVVIETVGTCKMREAQWRFTSIPNYRLCPDSLCLKMEKETQYINNFHD